MTFHGHEHCPFGHDTPQPMPCPIPSHYPIARLVARGVCDTCGEVHLRCVGHKRTEPRRGKQCSVAGPAGSVNCKFHGGGAPQVRAAAAKRLREEKALGEVGKLYAEAHVTVAATSEIDQLQGVIRHAGTMALCYRLLLDELPERSEWSWEEQHGGDGKPTRWVTVDTEGRLGPDGQGVQQLHAYEEASRYWTGMHLRALKVAGDLGLAAQRQAFEQGQVRKIGDAFRLLVAGLGRELDEPDVVPVVQQALELIAGSVDG